MRRYARHYQTGEPIPEEPLRRLLAARNFNQGFATVEYTGSALLDLELHRDPAPEALDVARFEREFIDRIGMPQEVGLRHRPARFQHLFAGGGYAAGYYAYLWAEVLDADGFAAFTEAGDVFDSALAERLKDYLQRRRHARPDGALPGLPRSRADDRGIARAARPDRGLALFSQAAQEVDHRSIDLPCPLLLGPVAAARQHNATAKLGHEAREVWNQLVHPGEANH